MNQNIQRLQGESNISWGGRLGGLCADELKDVTSEKSIREIVLKYWKPITQEIVGDSIRRIRSTFVGKIAIIFPDSDAPKPGYYYTNSREREYSKLPKEERQRFEHLAFWFASSNQDRWDIVGDEARENYKASFEGQATNQQSKPDAENQLEETPKPNETTLAIPQKINVEDLKELDQLLLSDEEENLVEDAIALLGISLSDFLKKACIVYAKTVAGKMKMSDEDLSTVPTQELLTGEKYKTHPNRAGELCKRAIYALEMHNDKCSEREQKWHINQTAIQNLTGSKPATIKKILENYQTRLDDHNTKHDLNPYDNRKRTIKITQAINLAEAVPDGLDVI